METTKDSGRDWLADFVSATRPSTSVLWAYLWWYIYIVATHFNGASKIWGTAAGVFLVVALALNTNAYYSPFFDYVKNNTVAIIRFFLIPFCLSSYSALVAAANADVPDTFFAIFPEDGKALGIGFGVGVAFFVVLQFFHWRSKAVLVQRMAKEGKEFRWVPPPPAEVHKNKFQYFVHCFRPNVAILWGIIFWYMWIVLHHIPDNPQVWYTGLVAGGFVGIAHNSNVYRPPLHVYFFNNPWRSIRFYMIPFFVASYSGAVAAAGFAFFPPDVTESAVGVAIAVAIVFLSIGFHKIFADPEGPKLVQHPEIEEPLLKAPEKTTAADENGTKAAAEP